MREQDIIRQYLAPLSRHAPQDAFRDDAEIVTLPEGAEFVITTDMLVENIHFLKAGAPEDIAWKALAANISDIASMGATPLHYQLALGLTHSQNADWMQRFSAGLREAQQAFGVTLSGGDTVRGCPALTLSITAHGMVQRGDAISRSGAKDGDYIYVTGTLGDAAMGLAVLQGQLPVSGLFRSRLIARHWRPEPRIAVAEKLSGLATSMMDISDGIMVDCAKLCDASSVSATLMYEQLPLSETGKHVKHHHIETFEASISAGDDYELLFTAPSELHSDVMAIAALTGVPIAHVGWIEATQSAAHQVQLHNASGNTHHLPVRGYEH